VTFIRFLTVFIAFFLYGISLTFAQVNKIALQKKQQQLLKEIELTGKKIQETSKNKQITIEKIEKITGKIQLRKELISSYQQQVNELDNEISVNASEIGKLTTKLNNLKADYGEMVFNAYKNRGNYDKLLYIFGAKDANKAFQRAQYFKRLSAARKDIAFEIQKNQERLNQKLAELNQLRQQKNTALSNEANQKAQLEKERIEQEQMVVKLKGKEKELKAQLAKKERERIDLENKIRKIIEAEILAEKKRAEAARIAEEKRRKAAEAAKTNENKTTGNKTESKVVETPAPKPVNLNVTPETKELSDQFEGNKGRLPWPVEKGTISGGFGITAHPYLKGVTIKNDGVDISTSQGAEVRAVFKGKVSGVFAVQGYGKVIILRHGEYLTVYSNLAEVAVSKDANVSLKQKLGRVETSDNGKTFINFQIRKGSLTLNPQSWLAAM